ncbi:MAG: COX15/CtaA family protein [Solirubrobacterales bacterium]
MLARLRARTNGFTVTPRQYTRIAYFALAVLILIVFSGAAVRLTASGLGCPDWPRCYGKAYPPLDTHSMIEFGNRVFSGFVTLAVLAAAIGALRRRPYRRDIAVWAWLLPLGAFTQAALGAFTVKSELAYGWVMAHFTLSMVMMIAAVVLVWLASHEPGWRRPSDDKTGVWMVRALAPLTLLTILSGVVATAAGPHAGGEPGQVDRFEPKGGDSLEWIVHRHGRLADVLGILAVITWAVLWRRGAPKPLRISAAVFVVLIGLQGMIGSIQWMNQLPSELVWLHVVLATLSWVAALWLVLTAGVLASDRVAQRHADPASAAS